LQDGRGWRSTTSGLESRAVSSSRVPPRLVSSCSRSSLGHEVVLSLREAALLLHQDENDSSGAVSSRSCCTMASTAEML